MLSEVLTLASVVAFEKLLLENGLLPTPFSQFSYLVTIAIIIGLVTLWLMHTFDNITDHELPRLMLCFIVLCGIGLFLAAVLGMNDDVDSRWTFIWFGLFCVVFGISGVRATYLAFLRQCTGAVSELGLFFLGSSFLVNILLLTGYDVVSQYLSANGLILSLLSVCLLPYVDINVNIGYKKVFVEVPIFCVIFDTMTLVVSMYALSVLV